MNIQKTTVHAMKCITLSQIAKTFFDRALELAFNTKNKIFFYYGRE
jgi:hypothetical protein